MNLILALIFLWLALVVAIRRLVRGPLRPTWSWRHEAAAEFLRWLGKRTTGRGFGHLLDTLRAARPPRAPVLLRVETAVQDVDGIQGEWTTPENVEGDAVVLYLHGGGYIACSLDTHRELIARLALRARSRALGINYRLAPEHPFPAALDDAVAAYRWLLARGHDPARIVLAGDSAGGGLAVASLVRLRNEGVPLPAAAVLLSPWVDLTAGDDPSRQENAQYDYIGGFDDIEEQVIERYVGGESPRHHLISPIYAELAGLPPLLIQVGGAEVLRDQVQRFADKARDAGVEAHLELWEDMVHVWHSFGSFFPESRLALRRVGEFIRRRTGLPPARDDAA